MGKDEIKKEMERFLLKVEEAEKLKEIKPKKKVIVEDKGKHAEYFEGILQMRGIDQEILNYVQKRITNANAQVPTCVSHGTKFDIDYSVSDRRLIHKIGVELKAKFGGFVKESAQLFSRNHMTSKNVYRLNVFYKTHDVKRGHVIEIEELHEPYEVIGYLGDRLIVEGLHTKKKNHINVEKISNTLKKFKTSVVQIHPEIKIMDEDYQPVSALTYKEFKEGQNVKVVISEERYYIV